MTFNAKVVQFNTTTATANVAVSSVGFQPSLVFFYGTDMTGSTGPGKSAAIGLGWMVDATHRGCIASTNRDHSDGGPGDKSIIYSTQCYALISSSNAAVQNDGALDFISMDTNGFTVKPTTAFTQNWAVNALCLGGADLTNVTCGTMTITASNGGTQDLTGVGFQPDCLLMFGNVGLVSLASLTTSTGASLGFSNAVNSGSTCGIASNGNTDQFGLLRTGSILTLPRSDAVTERMNLTLTNFLSDGFRVTIARSAGSEQPIIGWLALKGLNTYVGTIAAQLSTGNFSKTGLSFQPSALVLASTWSTTVSQTGSATGPINFTLGAATSATSKGTFSFIVSGGAAGDESQALQSSAKILYPLSHSVADTFVSNGDMDFVSMDSTGWTLNQVTAAPSPNQVIALAFGPATGGGGGSIGVSDMWKLLNDNVNFTATVSNIVGTQINNIIPR